MTVMGTAMVGLEKEQYKVDDNGDNEEDENVVASNMKVTSEEKDDAPPTEHDILIHNTTTTTKDNNKKQTRRVDSYAERRRRRKQPIKEIHAGMFWSVSNVILHTFGALITKKYGVGMTTWEINLIRFGFAGICMLIMSIFMKTRRRQQQQQGFETAESGASTTSADTKKKEEWFDLPPLKSWALWMRISVGVLFVSFFQPALTNYAMFQIALALLLTLESIGPIYSLPLAYILQKEKPTIRAGVGACLAVGGIILLAFRGMPEN